MAARSNEFAAPLMQQYKEPEQVPAGFTEIEDAQDTSDAVFQCPMCNRRFTRRFSLQEHIKLHSGEKEYVCPAPGCNKRFSTTGNLARHRRRHGYIPPLACPVNKCKYSTNAAHKLARHMKSHTDAPERICRFPGCDKKFATTGNLNRHIKNQHGLQSPALTGAAHQHGRTESADLGAFSLQHEITSKPRKSLPDASEWTAHEEEMVDTLSLLLDSEGEDEMSLQSEDDDGFDCSPLLDELVRFHTAQSPPR